MAGRSVPGAVATGFLAMASRTDPTRSLPLPVLTWFDMKQIERMTGFLKESAKRLGRRQSLMREIFSDIYHRNAWGDCESVSGPGSGMARTAVFRDQVAEMIKEVKARTLLDAGCGDFNWLKEVSLNLDQYIGGDVVPELITENRRKYGSSTKTFITLDIARDALPRADVILCRDCLVHLSFEHIFEALRNIKKSKSTYLLTTTFINLKENIEISTGEWRRLNLQIPPFSFPEPLRLIDEKCTHSGGIYADKHLALWAVTDIPR